MKLVGVLVAAAVLGLAALAVAHESDSTTEDQAAEVTSEPKTLEEAQAAWDPNNEPTTVIDKKADGGFQEVHVLPAIPESEIPSSVRTLEDWGRFVDEYDRQLEARGYDTPEEKQEFYLQDVPSSALKPDAAGR